MASNDRPMTDKEKEDEIYTKDGTVDCHGNPTNKNKTGTWKACPFILGNECSERMAYCGMSSNLVLYFKNRMGQHSATASKNVADWIGACYFTPLIGGFLADAYLGRYWTIAYFSIIYVIGMTLLALSASVPGIKPTCNEEVENCHATVMQNAVAFLALYLIALGTGGIKPCVSSFGADQFDDADEAEKEKKGSFFNWFYFSLNIGALVAMSVIVWIQVNVGWGLGFAITAAAMAIAVVLFFSGTRLYRQQKPGGSPLTRICQVVVASLRKLKVEVPDDKRLLYEVVADTKSAVVGSRKLDHTSGLSFLDKAAVVEGSDDGKDTVNPWRLCTVTQVEELKAVLRLLPVWATGIILATVYSQMSNYYVLQGETKDTHLGPSFEIPPASLGIFDTLGVLFWVPIYDRLIVPIASKITGNRQGLTQLQRMGIGLFISIFSVFFAGVLELVRLRIVQKHNYKAEGDIIPISAFWQVPQYFITGCAEVFTFIGQLEFFYEQAPDAMRSVCSALSLLTVSFGQFVSSLLVTIVTKITTRNGSPGWLPDNLNIGKLHYFFWLLSVLSVINFVAFLGVAKFYKYKRTLGTLPSN